MQTSRLHTKLSLISSLDVSRRETRPQTVRDLPSRSSHIHHQKRRVHFYHQARETTSQSSNNFKRVKLKRKFQNSSVPRRTTWVLSYHFFQTKLLTPGIDIRILKFPLTVSSICQVSTIMSAMERKFLRICASRDSCPDDSQALSRMKMLGLSRRIIWSN